MIDIGTILFFFVSLSVLFIYRITRNGYKSIFFSKDILITDENYKKAEKIRIVQVLFGFCFFIFHSVTFLGLINTILFFVNCIVISLLFEIVGTNKGLVFGKYSYNLDLCPGPSIKNVPILIVISWAGLIYMSLVCSMMIMENTIITNIDVYHIILASIFLTILDLVLDPIAVNEGRWKWENPGKYYGVPLKNFIGWFFNSCFIGLILSFTFKPFNNPTYYSKYIEFSPGLLFIILPAIAARPCFERNLIYAGYIGVIFSVCLILFTII